MNFGAVLKSEISRLARSELKAEVSQVRKQVSKHRMQIGDFRKRAYRLCLRPARGSGAGGGDGMNALRKRMEVLENSGAGGLVLLLVSPLPGEDRETAICEGVTYTRAAAESGEQFRERLAKCLKPARKCFVWAVMSAAATRQHSV